GLGAGRERARGDRRRRVSRGAAADRTVARAGGGTRGRMSGRLAVLGAINVDLVVSGAPLPRPGETATGGTFARHQGGKGGNQATAAARTLADPGRVVMLGAVGEDDLGVEARGSLEAEGIDVSRVRVVPGAATGVALIAVDGDGENQISVASGANDAL